MKTYFKDKSNIFIGVLLLLILVLLASIAFTQLINKEKNKTDSTSTINANTREIENNNLNSQEVSSSDDINWFFDNEKGWITNIKAPSCEEPFLLDSPVDLTKVTSILYPGQYRGGNYKAHGGFRFDNNSDNFVNVYLPYDAKLISGSRYIENGNVQYILDFLNPCGIKYRFDHLAVLAPEFQEIVEKELPQPKVDDSRGYNFQSQNFYKTGTLVATQIGFATPTLNVGMDFGVYDLRKPNEASLDQSFAKEHAQFKESIYYGICWLNNLKEKDLLSQEALNTTNVEGTTSDYCK